MIWIVSHDLMKKTIIIWNHSLSLTEKCDYRWLIKKVSCVEVQWFWKDFWNCMYFFSFVSLILIFDKSTFLILYIIRHFFDHDTRTVMTDHILSSIARAWERLFQVIQSYLSFSIVIFWLIVERNTLHYSFTLIHSILFVTSSSSILEHFRMIIDNDF